MRVLAPFMATIASVFTIVAAVVRIKWTDVQSRVYHSPHTGREALPQWVKTALTVWLIVVFGGGSIALLFVFIKILIDLSH